MAFRGFVLSALLLSASSVFAQTVFDWSSVQATTDFSWVDCYEVFQCARLRVPLDYSKEDGSSVGIALIKYPAKASDDDYRGMVLFNPGGPGGSGVDTLPTSLGARMVRVLGPQYDIVSFDPRGVGVTTPRAEFFHTDTERALWMADPNKFASIVNATHDETLLPKLWASSQLLGQMAKDRDTAGLLPYIGTENVARDMLRIIDTAGQEKLLYWGVSYGTVLGATFAAMFPDRVERLILDGVQDVEAHYLGDERSFWTDTDKSLQVFVNTCVAAGPARCAFYADTPSRIQANLENLYSSVLASPVPVYSGSSSIYGTVDYNVLKNAVFQALYAPVVYYSLLARGLAELQAGNGTTIYTMQLSDVPYECGREAPLSNNAREVLAAVRCGDAVDIGGSAADLVAHWDEIKDESDFVDAITISRITCMGWKVYREGRFMGPISGNTSFPLLVIGNTADPVTPLEAAKKTAAGFTGAVVLTQDSPGHSSFNVPSNCTDAYVQSYFLNGTLPEEGTVCPADNEFFSVA